MPKYMRAGINRRAFLLVQKGFLRLYSYCECAILSVKGHICHIGTNDGAVPYYVKWKIIQQGDSSMFQNNGDPSKTLSLESATYSASANVNVQPDNGYVRQYWTLERVYNPPCGILLYSPTNYGVKYNPTVWVARNGSLLLSDMDLTYRVYNGSTLDQTVSWGSTASNIATVSNNGFVTGKSPGTATITVRKSIGGCVLTASYTLKVAELQNGSYYVGNKKTGKYMDVENQSMDAGALIHQWEFFGGPSQKWNFTLQRDESRIRCPLKPCLRVVRHIKLRCKMHSHRNFPAWAECHPIGTERKVPGRGRERCLWVRCTNQAV